MSENEMNNLPENESSQANESKPQGGSQTVRLILHVLVIVILLLGIVGIIPKKFTIPTGAGLLLFISLWNAFAYRKQERNKEMAFTLVISVIIAIMLAVYFLLEFNVIG